MRLFFISLFVPFIFFGCAHKNIDGTNNLHSMMSTLVEESSDKIKSKLNEDDVILVSDFVNLDKLKNRTQLGFLLSDILKERLSALDIVIREIKFSKEFSLGEHGLNMLSRDTNRVLSTNITKARYAVVGTYSITSEKLNVFIKLIDMSTGYIHASSYESVNIDEEIIQLEGEEKEPQRTLRPRMVL